jgi:REP element-mobilizing transposase RayT
MKQRHSFTRLHVHVVFKTWRRMPLITGEQREGFLKKVMAGKAHELDAWLEGCGFWTDHGHVVIRYQPVLAVEKLVHDVKGVTAWMWNREHGNEWGMLKWQDGYWAASVCPEHVKSLAGYADSQREHHSTDSPTPQWEPPEE